jgi:hypothetical protein
MLQPHTVLRCLHALTDVNWDETGIPSLFDGEEPFTEISRSFGTVIVCYLYGEFNPANMVLYRLWERQNYLIAQQKCDEMYQAHLPGKSIAEARDLAVPQYVREETDKRINNWSEITPEQISEGIYLILRRAARWRTLVSAFESMEILLIDQRKQLLRSNTTLEDVLENGTDEEFEELKQFFLDPSNRVKDSCLRLTGVSKMIRNLVDEPLDTEIRRYLAEEIKSRVQAVFGESIPDLDDTSTEMLKIHPGPPQRYIVDIFGIRIRISERESSVIPQPSPIG